MTYTDSSLLDKNRTLIKKLSGAASVEETKQGKGLKLTGIKFNVWLNIDKSKAERHLVKLEVKQKGYMDHLTVLQGRLEKEDYVSKAPEEVILDTKMQIEEYKSLLSEIASEIKLFGSL